MSGLIGKKIGMTSIYDASGKQMPCTVIEAGPCVVTQVKTPEKDGYSAIQLAFEEMKEKSCSKPMKGHFAKANTTPKRYLAEFSRFEEGAKKNHGEVLTCDVFSEGEFVDVVGISKGKGFQGVVKRHGFSGVGDKTHGQHDRLRAPGSVGASSYPSRVFKGLRMAGRTGGPHGDAGLTGRKIIVDTYGGYARHGGGAFSGKDCTKVDRSAAYAARYVAKNIVAAGLADKCEIQLSYAIGVAQPTSVMVDTAGTGKVSDEKLVDIVRENFDLRPAGIIKMLDLRRPIYKQTAAYGHFGRNDLDLPWERLDKVGDLKRYL